MSTELAHKPEAPSPERTINRVRHNLVQAHGLDVIEQPTALEAAQQAALKEEFLDYNGELAKSAEFFARYGGVNSLVEARLDKDKLTDLMRMQPGDVVSLVKPPRIASNHDQVELEGRAGPVVRALAVQTVLDILTPGAEAEAALEGADARVFASIHNGAPVVSERVIHIPGYSVYEMNAHPVGSKLVIDSQVAVVKEA